MNEISMPREKKLFTPGPVNIPERVCAAATLGRYHHRTSEFSAVLMDTLEKLKPLFGTQELIMPVHTTGRGALEGVYNNLFSEKDHIICVANGSFGEMAAKTLTCIGVPVTTCFSGWDTAVDLAQLEQLIVEHKATGLVSVFNDTSNGVVNPVSEMGKLARKYNLLFVVDNVSALACMPFQMDDWGVDAVVTASQKGLMSPVGMSFVAMSKRAFAACERNQSKDFYINFKSIRKFLETKKETPGSTPVSVTLSVHEALNMIYEEGIENTFHRHAAISQGTKAALQALGFSLYPAQCQTRSDSLTVAQVPQGIHAKSLVKLMRDEYGIMIGGGLGDMGSTHVRVAHMGYCYVEDMLQCITVMEAALEALGCPEQMGKGTAAFLRAYRGAL